MAASTEETKISLKILVDKQKNKVVFAEADYTFVDILFSFMTLPMGTIVRLLGKHSDSKTTRPLGSLNRLYESIENLRSKYLWTEEHCKASLFNPRNSTEDHCSKIQTNVDPTKYFICEDWSCVRTGYRPLLSTYNAARCNCGKLMNREIGFEDSNVQTGHCKGGVFVTETTFIITDDLCVLPNNPCSSIQVLNDLGIKNMGLLEERTMSIGLQEMLDLLKWALLSKSPLTSSFLSTQAVKSESNYSDQLQISKKQSNVSMTVRVVMQKSNGKTLYTQADEDFIDFLFIFLTIPLGSVVHVLNGNTSLGCVDNLYKSISNSNVGRYLKSHELKYGLLNPGLAHQYLCNNQLFALEEPSPTKFSCYSKKNSNGQYCGNLLFGSQSYHNNTGEVWCPLYFKDPKDSRAGFVRGPAMFMVTDNFVVTPFSSISSLNFLKQLQVPLTDVEAHELRIGANEGLSILKASLTSSLGLTHGLNLLLKKPKQEI